jgi:LysM repeat protein
LRKITHIVFVCTALLALLIGCGGEIEIATPDVPTGTPAPRATPTATATQVIAGAPILQPTPETPTPTITPTPLVHYIQEGDTLGGIALQYGVSVQALQAVNGIENPLLLQIGQRIIIPTGNEEEYELPSFLLPTPTPLPFGVRGVGFYETPVGSLWCLGEVVNTGSYSLTNVLVQVSLFDEGGAQVALADTFLSANILPPSARAPFGILFVSPVPFASHQIAILRADAVGPSSSGYVPLTVDQAEGAPVGEQLEVTGIVRNATGTAVERAMVVVTVYDEEGIVTGFRQQEATGGEALAPAATTPFRIRLDAHGGLPADFSTIAFGRTAGE